MFVVICIMFLLERIGIVVRVCYEGCFGFVSIVMGGCGGRVFWIFLFIFGFCNSFLVGGLNF